MGKDVNELINTILKKRDDAYVPTGLVTWRLPTGIVSLDKILGGGLPGGSIVQIYGPEQVGKTSLAYRICAQAVKAGYSTLLIPLEKYSEDYCIACGVDVKAANFHKFAADYGELVFNTCIEAIRNYDAKVIVMDSISAARPKGNLEKKQPTDGMDKGPRVGAHAAIVGDFIEKMQQPIRRKEAIFITVNQLRSVISRYGNAGPQPTGGRALQYFSDIKLSMWGNPDRDKKEILTKITAIKGKDWYIIPYGVTEIYFQHGQGADIYRDLVKVCEEAGIVKKSGAWYVYGKDKFQGLSNFGDELKSNPKLFDELMKQAMEADVKVNTSSAEENPEPTDDDSEEGKGDE